MRVVPSEIVVAIDQLRFHDPSKVGRRDALKKADASKLRAIGAMLDRVPDTLITLVGNDLVEFYECKEDIVRMLAGVGPQETSGHVPVIVHEEHDTFTRLQTLLRQCPDYALPKSSATLTFLAGEPVLRDDLERDIAAVEHNAQMGEYKSATIIGGATIEALLFWAIGAAETKRPGTIAGVVAAIGSLPSSVDRWALGNLIAAAENVGLIDAGEGAVLWKLKDFRNLIHPGVASRTSEKCGKDTAYLCYGGIHLVIRKINDAAGTILP